MEQGVLSIRQLDLKHHHLIKLINIKSTYSVFELPVLKLLISILFCITQVINFYLDLVCRQKLFVKYRLFFLCLQSQNLK